LRALAGLHSELVCFKMPFDDYQKVREVYMGNFGRAFVVYRAADKKHLSMKEFSVAGLDEELRITAMRDVQTLASLKHPYIVRYCEKFMHGGQLCMVFDDCDDGNLWAFIRLCSRQRTVMPENQVVRWFTQICLAVKYLHERQQPILHGDIHTQNIFLTKKAKEGTVAKLFVEFGPMQVLDDPEDRVRAHVGTHFCQCPEICNRLPCGTPADVWALGCVLYELCAAHTGWESGDIAEHMENIMIAPLIHIMDKYTRELGTLAAAMLTHDPSQRPSADALLKTELLQDEMRKMLDGRQKAARVMESQSSRDNKANFQARGHREGSLRVTESREHREEPAPFMDQNSQRDSLYSGRDDAYSSNNVKGEYTFAAQQVARPLGDHNPRVPRTARTARSPSPGQAAKLLLMPDSARARPRQSSRPPPQSPITASRGPTRSPSPHEELAEALAHLLLGTPEARW